MHWPALSARAISVDDNQYLIDNVLVKTPSWQSAWTFLAEVARPSTVKGYYQPLSMISLMLDYAMGGRESDPRAFHATSLALHAANSCLLVLLVYLLLGSAPVAAMAGLLFGLHPMTVDPIPWISERKTLLAAFFSILCLVLYARHAARGGRGFYAAALAAFALALMSKPTSTPLPLGLVLLNVWPLKRVGRKALLGTLPFFAIAAVSALVTFYSQRQTIGVRMPSQDPAWHAPVVVCYDLVFYLKKMAFPAGITSHYPPPQPMDFSHGEVLTAVIAAPIILIATVAAAKWTRAPLACVGFFLAMALPTMGVIGFTHSLTANKFAYLPGVGIVVLAAGGLAQLWGRARGKPARGAVRACVLAGVLAVACLEAAGTRSYLGCWRDTETLRRQMLAGAPDTAWVRMDLAVELTRQGRREEAIDLLQGAAATDGDEKVQLNLGIALLEAGQVDQAIERFRKALEINPATSGAHVGLGNAMRQKGIAEQAIWHYRQAIDINPTGYEAYYNLGNVLLGQGKLDEAIPNYLKAVELQGDYPAPHHALAVAYAQKGEVDLAIRHHRQAIRLQADNVPSMDGLARLLIRHRDHDPSGGAEPLSLAERCCQLTGHGDLSCLDTLAAAYAGVGRFGDAIATAAKAVGLAESSGNTELAAEIRGRLALYRQGQALR